MHLFYVVSAQHQSSGFDFIISGLMAPVTSLHTNEMLCEMARIVKPGGQVFIHEAFNGSLYKDEASFISALKLAGFVDVGQVSSTLSHNNSVDHSLTFEA